MITRGVSFLQKRRGTSISLCVIMWIILYVFIICIIVCISRFGRVLVFSVMYCRSSWWSINGMISLLEAGLLWSYHRWLYSKYRLISLRIEFYKLKLKLRDSAKVYVPNRNILISLYKKANRSRVVSISSFSNTVYIMQLLIMLNISRQQYPGFSGYSG